jgi:hypothetical protein
MSKAFGAVLPFLSISVPVAVVVLPMLASYDIKFSVLLYSMIASLLACGFGVCSAIFSQSSVYRIAGIIGMGISLFVALVMALCIQLRTQS